MNEITFKVSLQVAKIKVPLKICFNFCYNFNISKRIFPLFNILLYYSVNRLKTEKYSYFL